MIVPEIIDGENDGKKNGKILKEGCRFSCPGPNQIVQRQERKCTDSKSDEEQPNPCLFAEEICCLRTQRPGIEGLILLNQKLDWFQVEYRLQAFEANIGKLSRVCMRLHRPVITVVLPNALYGSPNDFDFSFVIHAFPQTLRPTPANQHQNAQQRVSA
jgi:hypothetical protein